MTILIGVLLNFVYTDRRRGGGGWATKPVDIFHVTKMAGHLSSSADYLVRKRSCSQPGQTRAFVSSSTEVITRNLTVIPDLGGLL